MEVRDPEVLGADPVQDPEELEVGLVREEDQVVVV